MNNFIREQFCFPFLFILRRYKTWIFERGSDVYIGVLAKFCVQTMFGVSSCTKRLEHNFATPCKGQLLSYNILCVPKKACVFSTVPSVNVINILVGNISMLLIFQPYHSYCPCNVWNHGDLICSPQISAWTRIRTTGALMLICGSMFTNIQKIPCASKQIFRSLLSCSTTREKWRSICLH